MNGLSPETKTILGWVIGYAEFGLSIFACLGVLGHIYLLVKHRQRLGEAFRDLLQIAITIVCWLLLDGYRAVWDTSHDEHFPTIWSFSALTILFIGVTVNSIRLWSSFADKSE